MASESDRVSCGHNVSAGTDYEASRCIGSGSMVITTADRSTVGRTMCAR
jgi:hypothetical protein